MRVYIFMTLAVVVGGLALWLFLVDQPLLAIGLLAVASLVPLSMYVVAENQKQKYRHRL